MSKNAIKEISRYLLLSVMVLYCILLIQNSEKIMIEIISALNRCINVIIPSLFAFMAISGILINSGLYVYISKPFYPVTKYILKMPNNLFFVFLLGNIAGYPIGISLLSALVKEKIITKKSAEIMSCFCYAGGPAFLTGAVGLSVFGNVKIGILIFYSILISNTIMAIVINRIFKLNVNSVKVNIKFNSEILIQSVENAGKALFKMCLMILFFSSIMALLEHFCFFEKLTGGSENYSVILKSFFEISSISQLSGYPYRLIPIITSVCGLGGLCVIFQVISVYQNAFSLKLFYLTRPVCFVIQYTVSRLICSTLKDEYISISTVKPQIIVDFNNFIPTICLIMMIFILLLRKRLAFSKQICYNKIVN